MIIGENMNIEIEVKIELIDEYYFKTYTITKEDLQQIACNKSREEYPKAIGIYPSTNIVTVKVR